MSIYSLNKTQDMLQNPMVTIKYGQHTTVGWAAAEDITLANVLATDNVEVSMVDNGTNNVTIVSAVAWAWKITVTFSADPWNDAVISYIVTR